MMKRYLPVVLSVLLVIALAVPAAAGPFADVPENHWAYEAVKHLAAYGLVIGFPDGEYKGNEPMTRYQLAMVIARLLVSLDAQIKAEVEAAKTVIPPEVPAQAPPAEVVKEVVVEQPIIEKVVETTIVEKLKTEELDALTGRVDKLEGALALLDGDTRAKFAEVEAKIAKGDADAAAALAAFKAEVDAKLADRDSALNANIDAKTREVIALIDALRAEFVTELDILNARTSFLEDELSVAMERIAVLEEGYAALDEKVGGIDVSLSDHLAGHEKVKITGESTVKFKDVDIRATNPDVIAWEDPNDIFEDEPEDNFGGGDDFYEAGTDFKQELKLTLTAYPADGVTVKAGLATVTNLFGADSTKLNLEVSKLSLEVTTPGVLQRLFAGGVELPEGTFTPYTFWGDEILDDDGNPEHKGVVVELGYDRYSGTLLFTRMAKEVSPDYASYAFAGEGKVAITDNLNLRKAYVREWRDLHSLAVAEEDAKPHIDSVISVGGDFAFGEGWKVEGEFAKWTKVENNVEVNANTAANLTLTGVIGPVELTGEYVRVEDGYAPKFVFLYDSDLDEGLKTDVKTIGASAKATLIEALTLTGGYKITGNADVTADWDLKKHAIAEAGAAYEMAWGAMTLTPSLNLKHTRYIIDGSGQGYGADGAVLETTAAVKAEFAPVEATYTYVDGRVKGTAFEPYFKSNKLEIAADYDVTEAFEVHGGYTWDKKDYAILFAKDADVHESEFNVGASIGFAVYEGIKLNASYDYAVANDHLFEAKPYTKSILKTGVEAQVTPKSKIDGKAEFYKLDRFYFNDDPLVNDYEQYDYAPATNIIGEVNYTYDITTNTALKLGYKVVKSDVGVDASETDYDYLARVISGSLKVTF